jgi:hypothetical protein
MPTGTEALPNKAPACPCGSNAANARVDRMRGRRGAPQLGVPNLVKTRGHGAVGRRRGGADGRLGRQSRDKPEERTDCASTISPARTVQTLAGGRRSTNWYAPTHDDEHKSENQVNWSGRSRGRRSSKRPFRAQDPRGSSAPRWRPGRGAFRQLRIGGGERILTKHLRYFATRS